MSIWILDATTKSITVTMTGAPATTNPDYTTAWADDNGTTVTPGSSDGTLNGTTPVTIVAAPAASTRRMIKNINIYNTDTATVTFYVKYVSGGTRILKKVTLLVDEVFTIENNYDATGAVKTVLSTVPSHGHTGPTDGSQLNAGSALGSGQVALARGGTNADLSATGGTSKALWQESGGAAVTVRVIADADLPTTLAGKTLTTPTIASFVNANHTHLNSAGGGLLTVAALPIPDFCEGRLTLTSGTPVTTSNVTAAGTIYFTPTGRGSLISLYDGSNWAVYLLSEISLALTLTSGKNYDVFVYNNSGTLTLELSAAWTNDTTRADALTTQNGVQVKSGATTRRYLGTIRASGANTTEDSDSKAFVQNYYNQVPYVYFRNDTTDTWSNSGNGTLSAMNSGNAAWKFEFVVGLSERPMAADSTVAAGLDGIQAIGLDTSTTLDRARSTVTDVRVSDIITMAAQWSGTPGIGYHYLQTMQTTRTASAATFYGDNGGLLTSVAMNSGLTVKGWR